MDKQVEFSFGDDSIAESYEKVLVPHLFEPWALQLIKDNQPWAGSKVLDLACGTGAVTRELARSVGPNGRVIALDMNSQMLDIAKSKCEKWGEHIDFIEGSCESLAISDESADVVVCQQGFQFFPDKKAAALEIYRVLKPGGRLIVSTWCSVSECEIFGAICKTLETLNENEISQMMRIPFGTITKGELQDCFRKTGFSRIELLKQEINMHLDGGVDRAIIIAYATPIAPKLKALSIEKQEAFKKLFATNIQLISQNEKTFGRMTSNVLRAVK